MQHLPIVRRGRVINYARVDDDTYYTQAGYTWYLQTRGKGGKAQITRYTRDNGKTKNVFLAREVMGIDSSSPKQVYPLDGDPFNMQRDNLGVAAERRRIQHRATVRKLGGTQQIPQMGIHPILKMAAAIEGMLDGR